MKTNKILISFLCALACAFNALADFNAGTAGTALAAVAKKLKVDASTLKPGSLSGSQANKAARVLAKSGETGTALMYVLLNSGDGKAASILRNFKASSSDIAAAESWLSSQGGSSSTSGGTPPPPPPPSNWANAAFLAKVQAKFPGINKTNMGSKGLPAADAIWEGSKVTAANLAYLATNLPDAPPPPPSDWTDAAFLAKVQAKFPGINKTNMGSKGLPAANAIWEGSKVTAANLAYLATNLPAAPTPPPTGGHAGGPAGSNPADTAKIAQLEAQLQAIYAQITGGADKTDVVAKVQALQADATAKAGVEAQLATAQHNLTTEQGKVAAEKAKVATLQPKADALDAVVTAVGGSASTANVAAKVGVLKTEAGKVAGLQHQVAEEQGKVATAQAANAFRKSLENAVKSADSAAQIIALTTAADVQALLALKETAEVQANYASVYTLLKKLGDQVATLLEPDDDDYEDEKGDIPGEVDTAIGRVVDAAKALSGANSAAVDAAVKAVQPAAAGGTSYRARALGRLSAKRTVKRHKARKSHKTRVKRASRRSRRSKRVTH